jgi:heptosyltransferase II
MKPFALTPQNIIVRMPNWIGDLIMALPILEDLKKYYPNANLTAMCKSPLCELLKKDPHIDELFCFHKAQNFFQRRKENKNLIGKLKAGEYDLAVLLTNSFSSAWWFYQAHIPYRLGYESHFRSFLLNIKIPFSKEKNLQHQVITYKQLLSPLGISISSTKPTLYIDKDEKKEALTLLQQRGYVKGHKLIAIHPGATYGSAKCWLPERFEEVAKRLLNEKNTFLVFLGDYSSANLIKNICLNLNDHAINLAGATTIRQLAALIGECHLLLTNDSGPMHIAAALDIPVVALFGSTDPIKTGPFGQEEGIIGKKVLCSPCYKRVCPKDFRCMKEISSEEVFQAVQKRIKNP